MTEQSNKLVLVAVSDLFFAVQILDSAKRASMRAEIVKTAEELRDKAKSGAALVIFDLHFDSLAPIERIRELKRTGEANQTFVVAFGSHVQVDLKKAAEDAGCDLVLPRSAFAQRLPQILERCRA